MNSNCKILRDLALYIHWPFCISKCPYCDFNSHVQANVEHNRWEKTFIHELKRYRERTGERRLVSIFFGGGTPSLMPAALVQTIIDHACALWSCDTNIEITLEANPSTVEQKHFKDFRAAGVNRISIGVQSLYDEDLKFLGRRHSAGEAKLAIRGAMEIFDRVSFDLIYARPEQKIADWRKELNEALEFGCKHLSLYQLTIEPGTSFYTQYQRGDFMLPADHDAADFYDVTQEIMENASMPAYEVSNHATRGEECIHNLVYWNYGEYVGIGPGAHGRVDIDGQRFATYQKKAPESWLRGVENDGHGDDSIGAITNREQALEYLMMGLRTTYGINLNKLESLEKEVIQNDHLDFLIKNNMMIRLDDSISVTQSGRKVLNSVLDFLVKNG